MRSRCAPAPVRRPWWSPWPRGPRARRQAMGAGPAEGPHPATGPNPVGLSPSPRSCTVFAMQENPLLAGLGLPREPRPLTLVIFGASGDLTRRKLVPALFSLYLKGSIPGVRIVGFARRDWDSAAFRKLVRGWLDDDDVPEATGEVKDAFA